LLAGACAGSPAPAPVRVEERDDSGPVTRAVEHGQPTAPAAVPRRDEAEESPSAPAVIALLAEADRSLGSGHPDVAAATLERALRIAPSDPRLWHRLARVRLRQRRWSEAEGLARKSISLAAGMVELSAANWILIATAREGAGDVQGARQAKEKATALRQPH
ncbi:MAG: tetratricopeptide repeat protein, partial [Gammaproteobacteria bacterium]